jgi:very-short-patch-repair endonuclease
MIAGRQHGVITTAQLVGAGLGSSAISKRATNGRLHRRYQGVYAVGQPRLSQQGEWIAATLACGPGAYLASLNAAVHMKLWRRRVTDIHVLAPRKRSLPGVRVRAYRSLDRRDVTVRDGIPVTTVPRTLVDLSDLLTAHQLANVIHEAAFRKLFDERAVRAAIHRANGRHNLHVLNQALELNQAGSAGTRSELEDRFLALTCKSGLPEPLVNTQIEDLEVDFHWPQLSLVVEVDGPGHTRPRTKREDRERDTRLRAAGHTVLRVRDHEIDHWPETVAASLRSAAKLA